MNRRALLMGGTALLAMGVVGYFRMPSANAVEGDFEISLTPEQWRERLSPAAYTVLREEGTEPPFSSPLDTEKRDGIFACAGCELPLFDSTTKYDSRTGWPSFYQPIAGAVGESTDYKLIYPRTEVHCARCGGHLGHVFTDGPQPTGLRYCMNGVAMVFQPRGA